MAWSEDKTTKTVVPRIREYTGLIVRKTVSRYFGSSGRTKSSSCLPIFLGPFLELVMRVL